MLYALCRYIFIIRFRDVMTEITFPLFFDGFLLIRGDNRQCQPLFQITYKNSVLISDRFDPDDEQTEPF